MLGFTREGECANGKNSEVVVKPVEGRESGLMKSAEVVATVRLRLRLRLEFGSGRGEGRQMNSKVDGERQS